MEATTDWQGNVIKEGDEICVIQTKKNYMFKKPQSYVPNLSGGFDVIDLFEEPEEDCWIIEESYKVVIINDSLYFTYAAGEYTVSNSLSIIKIGLDQYHLLAIKGVSDMQPKQLPDTKQ